MALERLVLVGGDEGEDAVVRRVRRAVRDPEMELKCNNSAPLARGILEKLPP